MANFVLSGPAVGYESIYLKPRLGILNSRAEADISVEFLGRRFKAPWIPANMESVITEDQAKWLSENDYFYIMHRFNGATRSLVERANKEGWKLISVSVGVNDEDKDLMYYFYLKGHKVDVFCIDVAHGHHQLVKDQIKYIKAVFPDSKIIAGNVATPEAIEDLALWGADAVKVGIAGGAACSTKHQTGFHVPMFTCVKACGEQAREIFGRQTYAIQRVLEDFKDYKPQSPVLIPIIADGGVRENGDIPKALVAGATMVMAGSLFAACTDSPGENVYDDKINLEWVYRNKKTGETRVCGYINSSYWHEPWECLNNKKAIKFKKYHGSASAKQKGQNKHVEGVEMEIPCNGLTLAEKYVELRESLQSAVSYAGGKDLEAFKNVEIIIK